MKWRNSKEKGASPIASQIESRCETDRAQALPHTCARETGDTTLNTNDLTREEIADADELGDDELCSNYELSIAHEECDTI